MISSIIYLLKFKFLALHFFTSQIMLKHFQSNLSLKILIFYYFKYFSEITYESMLDYLWSTAEKVIWNTNMYSIEISLK